MTRSAFKEAVFARDGGVCVACGLPAVDAHHILDRKLFADGGYVLDNGASLCERCHLSAESTTLSAREIRQMACISSVVLPAGLDARLEYNKWGDSVSPDGTVIAPGPLEHDTGRLRAMAAVY